MTQDNEYVQKLIAARDREVAHRRHVAETLAEKHNRGDTENTRDAFIKLRGRRDCRALVRAAGPGRGGEIPQDRAASIPTPRAAGLIAQRHMLLLAAGRMTGMAPAFGSRIAGGYTVAQLLLQRAGYAALCRFIE